MQRHPPAPQTDDDFLRSLVASVGDDNSSQPRKPRRIPIPFKKKSPKRPCAARPLRDVTNATPTKQRAEKDLAELLEGLDDSFFQYVPSPDPSPVKAKAVKVEPPMPGSIEVKENQAEKVEDMEYLMQGAEDWDWADMEVEAGDGVKTGAEDCAKPASLRVKEPCVRCVVESIDDVHLGRRMEKHVLVRVDTTPERRLVILRDDWVVTPVQPGDVLNILGAFLPPPTTHSTTLPSIALTSAHNTLIHHPDVLLPPTSISTSSQCMRKPLISSLLRSAPSSGQDQNGLARSMLWGNLLHEVVQRCLAASSSDGGEGGWSREMVEGYLEEVVYSREGVEGCFRAGVSVAEGLAELRQRAGGLEGFSRRFIGPEPKDDATLTDSQSPPPLLALTRTRGIEEDIWSPTYGLKGKIDASVQVAISTPLPSVLARKGQESALEKGTMPFEIKTGRASKGMEHRAQTVLYTLLLADRYDVEVPAGLLYYTQSDEVIRVPARRNEVRGLIMARNEMAEWMMRRRRGLDALSERKPRKSEIEVEVEGNASEGDVEAPFLPPPIDDSWACEKCYALDGCMLYRKAVDAPAPVAPSVENLFDLKTGHLTPAHTTFFRNWERLISLEENDMHRFRRELWTMTAAARESAGRCFGGMVRVPLRAADAGAGSSRIHRYTARFAKRGEEGGAGTLLNGHISVGDAVVVSVDPGMLALARGFVVSLSPDSVLLGLDHAVDDGALEDLPLSAASSTNEVVFRIDKDELSSGVARLRDNLARLFYASGGDDKRRSLIVDLSPPSFLPSLAPSTPELPTTLNAPQQRAMQLISTAQDYALVLGMPGTGKTTTIAEVIRMLVRRGKSVLLTSYTHSAVDTILLRLGEVEFGVLRLGNVDKVHPDVRKYTLGSMPQATTVEQLEQQLLSPPVVATTCLSIDHPLFSRRTFDYCIVDEASQITLPTCIGPLRFADVFVLVGDHFQLPPLVRNREARKGGLDVSLFRRLSDAHPEAVVDLTHQYRMNEDIMLLSNRLIYGDRLKCGSEEVARRSLVLPDREPLRSLHEGRKCEGCWIEALLDERCKAVFVDTDALPARDSRIGALVQNEVEAKLVFQTAEMLLRCGLRQDQLGIISLYRQQIKLLSHLFARSPDVEILTADRSQGRDKECIIISMVRSNEDGELGDLLKDWRRINVSFTRARSKLIIFGSRKTLQSTPLLADFFELMEEHSWIYNLQPGAHTVHADVISCNTQLACLKRPGKENDGEGERSAKVMKVKGEAVVQTRAILRDVMNEAL